MRHTTFLVALSVLAGCSAAPIEIVRPTPTSKPADPIEKPIEAPIENPEAFPEFEEASEETVAKLVTSQNSVATDLYTRVANGNDNLAMSPISISLAFGMVYAGAQDATAQQMASAFRYDLPQTDIHQAYGTVLRRWNEKKERPYELVVANRLFGEKTIDFRDMYLGVTGKQYVAELERLDFRGTPDPARVHINDWVAEQTNDRILDLLPEDSVKSRTSLVLTNAIFFKGKWKQAFPKKATQDATFTTPSGKETVKMMNLTGQHGFAHADGVKMLQLAYKGEDLAMQLVLPDATNGLAELEKKLSAGVLDQLADKLSTEEVVVSVPRFTVAPKRPMTLSKIMRAMGMVDAWDVNTANLRGMATLKPNENLFIQEAFHKAFVEVQEEGTEAAAATGVVIGMLPTSVPPPPKRFNADHPFIFVIRDLKTNAILFIGRVNDPQT